MLQQVVLYILTFTSGLLFGSFLNLVADRIPKGGKILAGRSKCDHCHKNLAPRDLIPLLSFFLARGRCRYCNEKLSWYYPLSEILTGLVFVGAAFLSNIFVNLDYGTISSFVYLTVVGSFYITLLLADLKYRLIPNKIVYPAIAFVLMYMLINTAVYYFITRGKLENEPLGVYLLEVGYLEMLVFNILKNIGLIIVSSLGIAGFFALLVYVTKGRGMGAGDIRLGFLIGLFNGFPFNIMAIFVGFILGAALSLVLVLLKVKSLKDTVPFGPFLIAGSIVALLWGPELWSFYIDLF